jgi:hypothetical protein
VKVVHDWRLQLSIGERVAAAEPRRQRRTVGDDDQHGVLLFVQRDEEIGDAVGGGAIEVAGRLVTEEQRR